MRIECAGALGSYLGGMSWLGVGHGGVQAVQAHCDGASVVGQQASSLELLMMDERSKHNKTHNPTHKAQQATQATP